MPQCLLECTHCQGQQYRSIENAALASVLAEGKAQIDCDHCHEKKYLKLVPPQRLSLGVRNQNAQRSVLAIDDDPATLRILQLMLQPSKYKVETAISADQAIEKLQEQPFDVIISDIKMPNFDGKTLYRFLLVFLPEYAQKTVFLTGDRSENTLTFLRECGCPWTIKPIELQKLEDCIQQIR